MRHDASFRPCAPHPLTSVSSKRVTPAQVHSTRCFVQVKRAHHKRSRAFRALFARGHNHKTASINFHPACVWPILLAFDSSVLFQLGQHHNQTTALLPHHLPKVAERRRHWILRSNVRNLRRHARDEVGVDVVRFVRLDIQQLNARRVHRKRVKISVQSGVAWLESGSEPAFVVVSRERRDFNAEELFFKLDARFAPADGVKRADEQLEVVRKLRGFDERGALSDEHDRAVFARADFLDSRA
mmetsp:Transcript_5184/g.10962  ORF Transcript_5184/g.10962 Transcript_5184/m.10962 type:complete len:242 (-) Transcript_5184:262-987(-)